MIEPEKVEFVPIEWEEFFFVQIGTTKIFQI